MNPLTLFMRLLAYVPLPLLRAIALRQLVGSGKGQTLVLNPHSLRM